MYEIAYIKEKINDAFVEIEQNLYEDSVYCVFLKKEIIEFLIENNIVKDKIPLNLWGANIKVAIARQFLESTEGVLIEIKF